MQPCLPRAHNWWCFSQGIRCEPLIRKPGESIQSLFSGSVLLLSWGVFAFQSIRFCSFILGLGRRPYKLERVKICVQRLLEKICSIFDEWQWVPTVQSFCLSHQHIINFRAHPISNCRVFSAYFRVKWVHFFFVLFFFFASQQRVQNARQNAYK